MRPCVKKLVGGGEIFGVVGTNQHHGDPIDIAEADGQVGRGAGCLHLLVIIADS